MNVVPQHTIFGREPDGCARRCGEIDGSVDVIVVPVREHDCRDVTWPDGGSDRFSVMWRVDDDDFFVITDEPDIVVDVPGSAVEAELPRCHDIFNSGILSDVLSVHEEPPSSTTERNTVPSPIFAKAASTSLMPIRSVMNASRSSRPC